MRWHSNAREVIQQSEVDRHAQRPCACRPGYAVSRDEKPGDGNVNAQLDEVAFRGQIGPAERVEKDIRRMGQRVDEHSGGEHCVGRTAIFKGLYGHIHTGLLF